MKQKPLSLNIIAFCYFIAPVVNILKIAWINHWPLQGPRSVFNHISAYEWIILACFPLVAIGIFRVAKWGYYFFLLFSAVLIVHNSYAYLKNPIYSIYLVLLFHFATIGMVGFFLQRHIVAPYFNPDLKWWEHYPRHKTRLMAEVRIRKLVHQCQILDISKGGCFIKLGKEFHLGDLLWLHLNHNGHKFQVLTKVAWVCLDRPKGYGLMFLGVGKREKKIIKKVLASLHSAIDKVSKDGDEGIQTA